MTMPWGSTEEPDIVQTMPESVPVHVVSDARKGGAAEFGQWRTFIIANTLGPYSATPGAIRIANRNLRRKRLLIKVNGTVGAPVTQQNFGSQTSPAPNTIIAEVPNLAAGEYNVQWQVNLGGTTSATETDNFQLMNGATQVLVSMNSSTTGTIANQQNVNITVPQGGTVSVNNIVAGTAASIYRAQLVLTPLPQTATDGVLVGTKEAICNGSGNNQPGSLGGYLQIGDNVRWECQQELWACWPSTNVNPVYLTVCDEVYASDPFTWKKGNEDE